VGGTSTAERKGLAGAAKGLGDTWGDLLEAIGKTSGLSSTAQSALKDLTDTVNGLRRAIDPTLQERKSQLEQEIEALESGFNLDRVIFGSVPAAEYRKRELRQINEALAAEELKAQEEKQKALQAAREAAADRDKEALLGIEREFQKQLRDTTETERDKILREAAEAKRRVDLLFKDQSNSTPAQNALSSIDASTKAKLAKLDEEAAKPALALAEANQKIVESLQKRAALEGLGDPRSKFIQAEVDKLNASATDAYRQKVAELAGVLYDREQATKAAKEADEAQQRAIEEINRELLRTVPSYDLAKQALDAWKEKMIRDLGEVTDANRAAFEALEKVFAEKQTKLYDEALAKSDKWEDGVTRGLRNYAKEATNAAKNAEELFGGAARKVEDTLVDMVSTGEFSFKKLGDLVQSIEQDILRIFIRQNITGPIASSLSNALGGGGGSGGQGIFGSFFDDIFSSIFHSGGVVGETMAARRSVPAHAFIGAPRLHNGLMPDEFPAILQKGETVIPKNQKMMGGMNVTFNISTPNPQAFMDSRGQMLSKFAGEMQRMRTRNG
jgi:lambda family phage tail tape measure protein